MHRTIEITVPAQYTSDLTLKLEAIDHVIGLSVNHGFNKS